MFSPDRVPRLRHPPPATGRRTGSRILIRGHFPAARLLLLVQSGHRCTSWALINWYLRGSASAVSPQPASVASSPSGWHSQPLRLSPPTPPSPPTLPRRARARLPSLRHPRGPSPWFSPRPAPAHPPVLPPRPPPDPPPQWSPPPPRRPSRRRPPGSTLRRTRPLCGWQPASPPHPRHVSHHQLPDVRRARPWRRPAWPRRRLCP
jgi:hypothetical protein